MLQRTKPKTWSESLASNTAFASIGAVMQRLCIWGMIVIFAKLGSPETVGYFALAMAIVLPINRFASLQLPQLILADPAKNYPFTRCLAVHLFTNGLSILLLAICISALGLQGPTSQIIVLLAVARAFEGISEICYSFFYQCHRAHIAALLQTLRGMTTLLLAGSSYYFYGDLWLAVLCMTLTYTILTCLVDLPVTVSLLGKYLDLHSSTTTNLTSIKSLALSSLPLGICSLLTISYASIPRYAIGSFLGINELGVFEALASLTLFADIVCQSLARTSASRFALAIAEKDKSRLLQLYTKIGLFYLTIGGCSVLLIALFGKTMLTLLYPQDFAQYGIVLAALMVARTISFACAYDTLLLTMGRYQTLLAIWLLSGVTLAFTAMSLVPLHGLLGMAIAIAVGNASRCILIHGVIIRFLSSNWWDSSLPIKSISNSPDRLAA